VLEGKGLIPAAAAVAAFAALFWGVLPAGGSEGTYSGFLFPAALFIGGALVSSRCFKKAHLPGFGMDYLMVPATVGEKFVSRVLMTCVGYALAVAVFTLALSALVIGLRVAFGHESSDLYKPWTLDTLRSIASYAVVNAVFVCGSLYFPRHALVKTALALGVFALVTAIYMSYLGRTVMRGTGWSDWLRLLQDGQWGSLDLGKTVGLLRTVLYYALAPLFWVVGWLRLRELQV